jgi:hypothetical protein
MTPVEIIHNLRQALLRAVTEGHISAKTGTELALELAECQRLIQLGRSEGVGRLVRFRAYFAGIADLQALIDKIWSTTSLK